MPAIRNAASESEREERPRRDTCRSGSYRPGGCTPSSEKAAMNENGTPRRPSTVRRRTPALLWRRSSRTPRRRARRRRAESITISQTLGKWLDRRHHDAPERYPTSNVQGTPLVSPSSNLVPHRWRVVEPDRTRCRAGCEDEIEVSARHVGAVWCGSGSPHELKLGGGEALIGRWRRIGDALMPREERWRIRRRLHAGKVARRLGAKRGETVEVRSG